MTRFPTFLVVGASKAGTTTVYELLKQHPDIYVSPVKEPHYFAFRDEPPRYTGPDDQRFNAGVVVDTETYGQLFGAAGEATALGECSVSYLYHPAAATAIHAAIPDCRIIILLRDPVERATSQYRQNVMNGRETLPFMDALDIEPNRLANGWRWPFAYMGAGLYSEQVQRYLDIFGHGQVKVWLFENLVASPEDVMREIYRFLDVAADFTPLPAVYNRSGIPKYQWVHRMLRSRYIMGPAKILLPEKMRHALRDRLFPILYRSPRDDSLKPDELSQVYERFAGDIDRLESLLGIDLNSWRSDP